MKSEPLKPGFRGLSFSSSSPLTAKPEAGSNNSTAAEIPHNSCFLVNGKERKLSNSYLRFQRRYSKHGTKDAIYDFKEGSVHMHLRGKPVQFFAPSTLRNNYSLTGSHNNNKISPSQLTLDWVYGYRGKDARSNLFLLPTGELVYFVASAVVLFNPEIHKQRHYLGHTEEVKCLSVHPNKILIATGQGTSGQDRKENKPHVRIWNSASLQTQSIIGIGEFERSVVCLSFSKDNSNFLVAVDEGSDHTMTIWDLNSCTQHQGVAKIAEAKCSNKETVVAAEFHPLDPGLIVTCGKGHVNFWHLNAGNATLVRKTGLFDAKEKPKYVTCLAFGSNGDVLTGDSSGNVFIWRHGYNAVTKSLKKVHNGPVFAICVLKDGAIVTGGGKDGKLVQFDANYKSSEAFAEIDPDHGGIRTICQGRSNQLIIGTTHNSILSGSLESGIGTVLGLGHDEEVKQLVPFKHFFLALAHDKKLRIWDGQNHLTTWNHSLKEVPNSCCLSPDEKRVLVGFINGSWMVMDIESKTVTFECHDSNEEIQTLQFSPNGAILAIGTKPGIIHLYQVSNECSKFSKMGRCSEDGKKQRSASTGSPINFVGQSNYSLVMDWSADSCYIRSNSHEASISFWNATTCRQISNAATLRDTKWQTQFCLMSFDTIGIWPETVDGTDLTVGCKNGSSSHFVSGDDFGKLKLYTYPVNSTKAQHSVYGGHSCAVTSVTFINDQILVSSGGKDTSIFQWKLSA